MNKKTLIQLSIIFVIFLIITAIFFIYFKNININTQEVKLDRSEEKYLKENSSNLIKELKYSSIDGQGNRYEIICEFGEISDDNPEIILMTNVEAKINLRNSEPIKISSNFAKYNNNSYETNFYDNVAFLYSDHMATSENIDLLLSESLVTIYSNIVYTNSTTQLKADRLEIDLITKNSKIFMENKTKKIKLSTTK